MVCGFARRFDPDTVDVETAGALVREWAAIAHAADAAAAMAAARVVSGVQPASVGAREAAEKVAKALGTTTAKAKDAIARGEGMTAQDRTREAATSGLLSPEQTSAITDAVAINPAAEGELLEAAARSSVGELRQRCAKKKAENQDLTQIEQRIHNRRCLRRWRDADGAEHLHATGTKRDMALVDQALKQLIDRRFDQARHDGVREPLEAYGFDALTDLASAFLDGDSSGAKRDPMRNLSVLRIDLLALVRGHVENGETCEVAGLGPISVPTAREMLGESVLKLVLTNGVEVRNVTHLGRGPSTAQKIALLWEQPLCTREGCGRRVRLEYDHVDGFEYRKTRHTRLDELAPLCEPDHDLKTHHGWALVEGTGVRPMVPPHDPRHPRHPGHERGRAP